MDPVLQEAGKLRENAWEKQLQASGLVHIESSDSEGDAQDSLAWDDFIAQLTKLNPGQNAYGREVTIKSTLEGFEIEGRMDFALLLWEGDTPRLRIVECKASRKDRTYHRIQVAVYQMLVRQLLDANTPLTIGGCTISNDAVDAVVARIDESNSENQEILNLTPLDLETENSDARKLLESNGPFARVIRTSLAELNYQIEQKCDDCVFSVHCLPESARLRSLQLLGLEPSTIRVFRTNGVTTIDDLADLDLSSEGASAIRADATFIENLELLQEKARARRQTLPGNNQNLDEYEVSLLRNVGQSQLPTHEINGHRLIRVYLSIEYDYVENRIGALAAHITKSERQLHTGFITKEDGRRVPNPDVIEQVPLSVEDADATSLVEERTLQGEDVIRFKRSPWTGNYLQDCSAERELIQEFLMALVDQIAEVAQVAEAPIHFYMWTRGEMSNLVEGCSRADSYLLGHLRELLGCRESLDQLIYSSLSEEVNRRYALGWTGRGLVVVSSLRWFGKRYHWKRRIAGHEVNLDHEFTQDIFDFKSTLDMNAHGNWAQDKDGKSQKHRFEIRSRFTDSLSAPYWRAYWRKLPDLSTVPAGSLRNALNRYNNARQPRYLEEGVFSGSGMP
ncbi:PD-(D/E)XK nuclease family protein [Acaryochloris sp. 'Moss Beach']|uniref:PD-(D/E)XK nuclease family protein n=1 Tax=Acaryochloris sp. 'Moss Beach' TaxID=2740837 RepID=UPI001F34DA01|nr:PD-(D/E)XK nuclease family protein [Acaryochloris sp. 'Moss Beach']UJB68549.1 PD-(D/E)XK nuclease family protein [Acaryochloris sp. 'Moss Beach']